MILKLARAIRIVGFIALGCAATVYMGIRAAGQLLRIARPRKEEGDEV